jgi:molecular chaperone DnaK (HSP70)
MALTRAHFEDLIRPMVDRSVALVRQTLEEQRLTPDDLTTVLLVGGSTAVPLVYESLATIFSKEKLRRQINPMLGVALGAAVLAHRLTGVECPMCSTVNPDSARDCSNCGSSLLNARSAGSISLGEVTPRDLGIEVMGSDGRRGTFAVIIPKGTPYPLVRPMDKVFETSSERTIRVPVYEGDSPTIAGNELQGLIEFTLPREVGMGTPVTVEFNYDKDRVLTIQIKIHGSDISYREMLSRDRAAEAYDAERNTWREALEATANNAVYFLEEYREFLEAGTALKLEQDIRKARHAYAESDRLTGQQVMEAIKMAVLYSGLASRLFFADQATRVAPADVAARLAQGVRELKEAHRRNDQPRVEQLRGVLELAVARVLREQDGRAAMRSRDTGGLLRDRN